MIRLSGWDASMLYSETPTVHMHTLKVAIIDMEGIGQHYGIEEFRQVVAGRLYKLDPFRFQLIDIPLRFHHPMWRENAQIDLEYHVRSVQVAAPGGRRQVDEAVGEIAGTPLDRTRPLWELHLLEGLAGNRVAVVGKVHHALADGVAAANLLAKGMDLSLGDDDDPDLYRDEPVPPPTALVASALRDHLRQIARIPSAVRYTADGIRRVRASSRALSPELAWPFTPPPSFINHKLDARRRFATATLSLSDVKHTASTLGVKVNDLVLGLAAGGLRALRLRYDDDAEHPLLASVPVSFDMSPDRLYGNRFSGMLVPLPSHIADPIERLKAARAAARTAKENHRLLGPELICRWSEYLPPAPAEALFRYLGNRDSRNKIFTLPISNVIGPRKRGRVNGRVVSELYSVGPLTVGSGLNITVWSYVDQISISVLADGLTVGDPHDLTEAMVEDFIAIRRAAGLSPHLTMPEGVMAP
ncbi:wax ester/triacylglycerol synthase family O-acyltransferase [Mycobacterium sp. 236(2023)]|uniref:WS/DGAT/MGAT family O-acyltransferase n=1 Tax=Mycobacterium sp. 236(2023) TaxID=3038163 RepID=UPI00241564F9|nr:wax ester/triacylglycerol synthase family O-acyltransferase [Mycobacterium sp. 236(2023)]MDG4669421.1 wax ester/triacylglycerol synthase family O-acyltransferase [Mycobacterium sp. 236(2023)]